MGWFFGFKLHLLINHKGRIVAFKITDGSTDDRKPLEVMTTALQGKVFADQGYLSQALLERLRQRGLHLVTGIRRNMKNHLMPLLDKVLLRKRFIMETLFEVLKSSRGLEHSRHRSPVNALVHMISCLAAYTLAQLKVNMGNIPIPATMSSIHIHGIQKTGIMAACKLTHTAIQVLGTGVVENALPSPLTGPARCQSFIA